MTKRNIIDGAVEYMPRKTKDGNPVVVRVPLLTATKEILDNWNYGCMTTPSNRIVPEVSSPMTNTNGWSA